MWTFLVTFYRADTTKVDHAIPLRDNWALPYYSCQVAALTVFLRNNISCATEVSASREAVPPIYVENGSTDADALCLSVDVLLSHYEHHHINLPPGLGIRPLRALCPRPLPVSARLVWPGVTAKGNTGYRTTVLSEKQLSCWFGFVLFFFFFYIYLFFAFIPVVGWFQSVHGVCSHSFCLVAPFCCTVI